MQTAELSSGNLIYRNRQQRRQLFKVLMISQVGLLLKKQEALLIFPMPGLAFIFFLTSREARGDGSIVLRENVWRVNVFDIAILKFRVNKIQNTERGK